MVALPTLPSALDVLDRIAAEGCDFRRMIREEIAERAGIPAAELSRALDRAMADGHRIALAVVDRMEKGCGPGGPETGAQLDFTQRLRARATSAIIPGSPRAQPSPRVGPDS